MQFEMACERPPGALGGSLPHTEGENKLSRCTRNLPLVRGDASEASEGVAHTSS
jgi:hypothetical protein